MFPLRIQAGLSFLQFLAVLALLGLLFAVLARYLGA